MAPAPGCRIRKTGTGTVHHPARGAQHLDRLEAAPGTLEERPRRVHLAAEQGLDGHRRSLPAAGERLGQRLRLGVDLHWLSVTTRTLGTAVCGGNRARPCRG